MANQVQVPECAKELAGLDRVDYADAFAAPTDVPRSPEQWLRSVSVASPALMHLVRQVHRGLGLRLAAPGSAGAVFGWTIAHSGSDDALLTVDGSIVTPRIVVLTPPGRVVIATLLRFDHVVARPLWTVVGALHRAVARHLVARVTSLATADGRLAHEGPA